MLYNTNKDNMPDIQKEELAKMLFGGASANWKRNRRIDLISDKFSHLVMFQGLLEKYNADPSCLEEYFTQSMHGKGKEFYKLIFPKESLLLTGESGSCKSSFLELVHELLQIRLRQIQRLRQYAIKTGRDFWKEKLSLLLKEHSVLFFKETDLRTIVSKAVKWPNPQNENAFYNLLDRISEVNYIIIDEAFYSSNWKFPESSASEYEAYFKIYADLLIAEKKKKGKIFLASSNNTAGELSASAPIVRRFSELFDRTIIMNRVAGK